jgi:hypothetical protein
MSRLKLPASRIQPASKNLCASIGNQLVSNWPENTSKNALIISQPVESEAIFYFSYPLILLLKWQK